MVLIPAFQQELHKHKNSWQQNWKTAIKNNNRFQLVSQRHVAFLLWLADILREKDASKQLLECPFDAEIIVYVGNNSLTMKEALLLVTIHHLVK